MNDWPAPAWLDCQTAEPDGDTVRCTIQVLGGGRREVVVPAASFDEQASRLQVRVVRPSEPNGGMLDCPSMEVEVNGFVVEFPSVDGQAKSRADVLATFIEPRY